MSENIKGVIVGFFLLGFCTSGLMFTSVGWIPEVKELKDLCEAGLPRNQSCSMAFHASNKQEEQQGITN